MTDSLLNNQETEDEKIERLYRRWREDTVAYVRECIGVGRLGDGKEIDSLQEKVLREYDNLIKYKRLLYLKREIPEELLIYREKIGIEVDSGKGLGKTSLASWIMLKCVHLYPKLFKGIAVAPKQVLLRDNLWGECSLWLNYSKTAWGGKSLLSEAVEIMSDKIVSKLSSGDTFFVARTSSRHASEADKKATMQGYHAPYLLVLVDECYGLDDIVYDPLTSTMTDPMAIAILLGNPSKNYGYAYNCRHKLAKYWVTLTMSALDSSIVSSDYVNQKRDEYKDNENLWRVNLLGLPPTAEADGLIPFDKIQQSIEKPIPEELDDLTILAVDIGGGGDTSDAVVMVGDRLKHIARYNSRDMMEVVRWIEEQIDRYDPDHIGIDGIGLGRGVYDRLRQLGYRVTFVDSRGASTDKRRYKNYRAELYWKLAQRFIEGLISIPDDQLLIEQLSMIKRKVTDDINVIQIKSKEDMAYSPNSADALMMCMAFKRRKDTTSFKNLLAGRDKYKMKVSTNSTWQGY